MHMYMYMYPCMYVCVCICIHRELYDEKLEDALEMLDLECSQDDDTKTQCNRLNNSPLHRGNASNKNDPARVKRRMQ